VNLVDGEGWGGHGGKRFSSIRRQGIFTTGLPTKNLTLNLLLSCPTKYKTPACV
jgi:hypothetical protein